MINGQRYDWESITITTPWGTVIDGESVEYSDEREVAEVYGKGSQPQGYGTGNYKAEGKLSLKREEFNRLVDFCKAQKRPLYRLRPFPVTVSYANEDQPIKTDVLRGCTFKKTSHSASQGDTSTNVELELSILNGILRDGLEPL